MTLKEAIGLKPGDKVIRVNGDNFESQGMFMGGIYTIKSIDILDKHLSLNETTHNWMIEYFELVNFDFKDASNLANKINEILQKKIAELGLPTPLISKPGEGVIK